MIRIEIIKPTRKDLKPFIMLPFSIYQNDDKWVAPLIRGQYTCLLGRDNDQFAQGIHRFFLAYDDDKPVARLLVGVDMLKNAQLKENIGYFSLFESYKNIDYARAVFDAACAFLRERGVTKVYGPVAPSYDEMNRGLLVQGYDGRPVLRNPYNPAYYADFLSECGFVKQKDYYAYFLRTDDFDASRIEPIVDRVQQRFGFRVENIKYSNKTKLKVARDIARVIKESTPPMPGYLPPTPEDIVARMRSLRPLFRSEFSVMAFAGDRPIGLVMGFPDYNQALAKLKGRVTPLSVIRYLLEVSRIKGVRCPMQYVIPEYQNKAVNSVMFYRAMSEVRRHRFGWVEGSTVDETHIVSINNTEKAGGKLYRVYRIFEMDL
jgi:GNAT superfamily N-acetyltransferase